MDKVATTSPKYDWRGYMLDVSRHFFTVDEVKRTLDLMHEQGLNVFHWHLTDGEGWIIPQCISRSPIFRRKVKCTW